MTLYLINPRNSLAPPFGEEEGHVWKPDSLINLAARFEAAGMDPENVEIWDENFRKMPTPEGQAVVGFNLVGAPWIPIAANRIREMRAENSDLKFVIGGVPAQHLSRDEVRILFGEGVLNGMRGKEMVEVCNHLGVNASQMPSRTVVDVTGRLERFSEDDMRRYLAAEPSFYLADGCIANCNFCAANKGRREEYRDRSMSEIELEYLVKKAISFEKNKLTLYLSNLDVFQSSESLKNFVDIVKKIKANHPGFVFDIRGLATLQFFQLHGEEKLLRELKEIGFNRVDFGVDGTPEQWRRIGKPGGRGLNFENCVVSAKNAGFDVGLFMVIGHPELRSREHLGAALDLLKRYMDSYQIIPRPYVSTMHVPGSTSWLRDSEQKRLLLAKPWLFHNLEYAADANWVKGIPRREAEVVNAVYQKMLALPGCPTKRVIPYGICDDLPGRRTAIDLQNRGQYDI